MLTSVAVRVAAKANFQSCTRTLGMFMKYQRASMERSFTPFGTRLRKSEGEVNIYLLAKNAGTSVEQLERFYLKNLEPSAEKVRNLQTFGSRKR